jgi:sugar-specific transcriptional regulator TrmB
MYNNNYTTMDKAEIKNLLSEIGLSNAEVVVYMSLLDGLKSVQDIIKATGEKRPTVYYVLNSLEKRGLVSKTGKEYGNKFQLESSDNLVEIVNKNIRKQNSILKKVEKIKDFYPKNSENNKVVVSYFDNLDAIKNAVFYSLYLKDKTIRTIVPGDNFFHEIGIDFVKEYVSEKNKRKIKTLAIWEDLPKKSVIDQNYAGSDIRQMPIDMHNRFNTTIFMYDDKTLYVGPKKENYAVLIQSKEHAKMMRTIFENIWSNSISLK